MNPTVSVIVTTHAWHRYDVFRDAVRSVEEQTYDHIELVCPMDADEDMVDATRAIADGGAVVEYHPNGKGLAAARNRGASDATGDIYAFLDDDCVADPNWIASLVDAYRDGAIAAGGPAIPSFPDGRPWYIPQHWDWLVGGGPYHDGERTIRNTYGCNISFRADVFDSLGGFDESLGKQESLEQGEETELCSRMAEEFGHGVRYVPEARVDHRVFDDQLHIPHLLRRAFAQGQTKRRIGVDDEETGFLKETLADLVQHWPHTSAVILAYTLATGAGFLSGQGGTI